MEIKDYETIEKMYKGHEEREGVAKELTALVRKQVNEMSLLRRLCMPMLVKHDDLDKPWEPGVKKCLDLPPRIIRRTEHGVERALGVSLDINCMHDYYEGDSYLAIFGEVALPKIVEISKFQLATLEQPLEEWVKVNLSRAIANIETERTLSAIEEVCPGDDIVCHKKDGFKGALVRCLKEMSVRRLPVGKMIMHKATYLDFFDDLAPGVMDTDFEGYPIVLVDGDDTIRPGRMYMFSRPNNSFEMFSLQEPEVFLETRMDIAKFGVYEYISVCVPNMDSIISVVWK